VGKGWASGKQRCRHHDGGYVQRVSIRPAGRMQQRKAVQTRATNCSTNMPTKTNKQEFNLCIQRPVVFNGAVLLHMFVINFVAVFC